MQPVAATCRLLYTTHAARQHRCLPELRRLLGHGVHLLRGAGHWVHADNPQGLFDLLAPSFGQQPDLRVQRSGWGGIPLSGEAAGAGGASSVLPFY